MALRFSFQQSLVAAAAAFAPFAVEAQQQFPPGVDIQSPAQTAVARPQALPGQAEGGHVQLPPTASQGARKPAAAPGVVDGGRTKHPRVFTHPRRGYLLPIPAEVQLEHRGAEMHVGVRSLKGFLINLQTGDANPQVTLVNMLGRLERRYLGRNAVWARKLSQKSGDLAGLRTVEAVYLGSGNRSRVIIARGEQTDFVFTFTAPEQTYINVEPNFEWMLEHFQPGPAEGAAPVEPLAANQPQSTPGSVRTAAQPDSLIAGRPAVAVELAAAKTMRRFARPGFGFHMDYPSEWIVENPSANTALFSGAEGTPAFDAVVSVQNVQPLETATAEQAAQDAVNGLKTALERQASDLTIIGEGRLTDSPGAQIMASYQFGGKRYRKWAVVVPRPESNIAHVWSYTAPETAFSTYRTVAEGMLQSWTLTP